MDIDNQEDRFLAFIDHARSVLSSVEDEEIYDPNGNGSERGSEQRRSGLSKNRQEIMNRLKRKHRRRKLAKTAIVDSVFEKNFLSLNSVLEAVIVNAFVIPDNMIASYYKLLAQMWKGYKKQNVMVVKCLTTWIDVMRIQDFHALIVDMLLTRCLVGRSNAASNCDAEVERIFHLKITLADETGKMFSLVCRSNCQSCCRYPLDEQFMHPSSPENESFIVALVNCQRQGYGSCRQGITQDQKADAIRWEITRALRCE
ncbi:hypothetical protein POTOM_029794 [Populus tomentosa]|uniref:Cell division control protein 24 OB domain-containing protein n=1 Tax=Populus tomentosa TaxID=118781 RepID=A0A8X7ZG15_POPTO|nr:hypothetical protein POTOM_029794 [Populus tomentosa]